MKHTSKGRLDVTISGGGSLYLFHLHSDHARAWVEEFVSSDRQFFGGALVVEHRYAGDLALAIAADSLLVEVL